MSKIEIFGYDILARTSIAFSLVLKKIINSGLQNYDIVFYGNQNI